MLLESSKSELSWLKKFGRNICFSSQAHKKTKFPDALVGPLVSSDLVHITRCLQMQYKPCLGLSPSVCITRSCSLLPFLVIGKDNVRGVHVSDHPAIGWRRDSDFSAFLWGRNKSLLYYTSEIQFYIYLVINRYSLHFNESQAILNLRRLNSLRVVENGHK